MDKLVILDFPKFMPKQLFFLCFFKSTFCFKKFLTRLSAPLLLNPILFNAACSLANLNNLGLGLPDWANLVTVPISAKPNPKSFQIFTAFPFLSKPAAKPTGLQKSIPHIFWCNLLSTTQNSWFKLFITLEIKGQFLFFELKVRRLKEKFVRYSASIPASFLRIGVTKFL